MKVPAQIHQTWKTANLPQPLSICMDSFRAQSPHWHHRFYTDHDLKDLFISGGQWDWSLIERLPTGVQKADLFRLAVLDQEGGIYADADIQLLRPLDQLLDDARERGLVTDDTQLILTTDHPIHQQRLYQGRTLFMNDFMIAKPDSTVLKLLLESLEKSLRKRGVFHSEPVTTTGPVALTRIIEANGGPLALKIAVLPWEWIHPLPDMALRFPGREGFEAMIRTGNWVEAIQPYAVHYWWHGYWSDVSLLSLYPDQLPLRIPQGIY